MNNSNSSIPLAVAKEESKNVDVKSQSLAHDKFRMINRIESDKKKALISTLYFLMVLLLLSIPAISFSQGTGMGINTNTPNTILDVNGDLALRITGYTATNGNNNNIDIGSYSFVRITGPSGVYTITGVAGGVDGKVVILYNATAFEMNIAHQNGSSTSANQIKCSDETNGIIKKFGCAIFIYSAIDSKWILVSTYLS